MVQCVVKRAQDNEEFLYETFCSISVTKLLQDIVTLHNHRRSTLRLAAAVRALAQHGPLRPEETRGVGDAEIAKIGGLDVHAYGVPTAQDENFQRTGVPPPAEIAKILTTTAEGAENLLKKKFPTPLEDVKEQLAMLKGAVMIAYPAYHRLPVYDPAREELEHPMTAADADFLEARECVLWWAGKELSSSEEFSTYIGKNEKTKVVLKLQTRAAGPPAREPRIDEETHKAMLAFYYKKQEERKKLKEDDEDDSYLASSWANPKALKTSLVNNGRDVSWKPSF
jgi:hypothetical protein